MKKGTQSPEGILKALGILGFKPEDAAYVGDMWMDVRAAQRAGVLSISVGWDASHDRALVDVEKPHAWMSMPSEFWAHYDSLSTELAQKRKSSKITE